MRFNLFLEARAMMGIVSPEGKTYVLPGANELNMVDYLRVNHIIDRNVTFGKLMLMGWVFYTHLNNVLDVRFKNTSSTRKLINDFFKKVEFDEIHLDDPYGRTWSYMSYEDFMRKGI